MPKKKIPKIVPIPIQTSQFSQEKANENGKYKTKYKINQNDVYVLE